MNEERQRIDAYLSSIIHFAASIRRTLRDSGDPSKAPEGLADALQSIDTDIDVANDIAEENDV